MTILSPACLEHIIFKCSCTVSVLVLGRAKPSAGNVLSLWGCSAPLQQVLLQLSARPQAPLALAPALCDPGAQISGSLARHVLRLPAGKGHLVTQVLLGLVPERPCGAQAGEHSTKLLRRAWRWPQGDRSGKARCCSHREGAARVAQVLRAALGARLWPAHSHMVPRRCWGCSAGLFTTPGRGGWPGVSSS